MTYHSTALGKYRRMHVYTPPGYESGRGRYPVFYLLHGAGDNDDSWSSVGRAATEEFVMDSPVFKESPGGHTWINWRNYLAEFVPQLFRSDN